MITVSFASYFVVPARRDRRDVYNFYADMDEAVSSSGQLIVRNRMLFIRFSKALCVIAGQLEKSGVL